MVRTIDRHGILPAGSRILVGVSGGVDSMVLLRLLHEQAPLRGWKLIGAHLNHQLRGRSSGGDERFVRAQCKALGLPCMVARRDVMSHAKRLKVSLEMAARDVRHRFLAQCARRRKCRVIALAHHADDQAELVLLRLLRGSGSEGLGGMGACDPSPADSNLRIARPLIEVRRTAISSYAQQMGVRFRVDASNACTEHLRNKVRHGLLPLLRKDYQPAIESVLCRTASILSAEADCIDQLAQQWLGNGTPPYAELPLAVRRRVIQLQARTIGVEVDFETVDRLAAGSGRKVNAPRGRHLVCDADGRLRAAEGPPQAVVEPLRLSIGHSGGAAFSGIRLGWRVVRVREWKQPARQQGRESFDADSVGQRILLRHWRAGDRFQPIGLGTSVKLQDLFTNHKVARAERSRRIVAEAETGEVFWVQGFRIGERFKVRPDTRNQLLWRWNCS